MYFIFVSFDWNEKVYFLTYVVCKIMPFSSPSTIFSYFQMSSHTQVDISTNPLEQPWVGELERSERRTKVRELSKYRPNSPSNPSPVPETSCPSRRAAFQVSNRPKIAQIQPWLEVRNWGDQFWNSLKLRQDRGEEEEGGTDAQTALRTAQAASPCLCNPFFAV